jgi:hypothetical protein
MFFYYNNRAVKANDICWSIILWNRPERWPEKTGIIYCELNSQDLIELGDRLYKDMLDFGEEYFLDFPESPKPVSNTDVLNDPLLLNDYFNESAWNNLLIEHISNMTTSFCEGVEEYLLINFFKVEKVDDKIYILFNAKKK